jgi:hypothetical protein
MVICANVLKLINSFGKMEVLYVFPKADVSVNNGNVTGKATIKSNAQNLEPILLPSLRLVSVIMDLKEVMSTHVLVESEKELFGLLLTMVTFV